LQASGVVLYDDSRFDGAPTEPARQYGVVPPLARPALMGRAAGL